MEVVLVLDNVRSIQNVGSIFRTADAAGVLNVYLCGITPLPVDRFGDPVERFTKTSLGAERVVSWEHHTSTRQAIKKIKKQGFEIVAVEQTASSIPYTTFLPSLDKVALIFGNEVGGILEETLDACDTILEIPMRGAVVSQKNHPRYTKTGKESLNVSVAVGIVLFSLLSG